MDFCDLQCKCIQMYPTKLKIFYYIFSYEKRNRQGLTIFFGVFFFAKIFFLLKPLTINYLTFCISY